LAFSLLSTATLEIDTLGIVLGLASILRGLILICGKAIFNSGDKPLFLELLITSNLSIPFCVKCSLFFIILNANLNNL